MFGKLKSLATKLTKKVKGFFGKRKPTTSTGGPVIGVKPPSVPKVESPKPTAPSKPSKEEMDYLFERQRDLLLRHLKSIDETEKRALINIVTSHLDELDSLDRNFVHEVEKAIANASDSELDEIKDAIGLTSNSSWKDYYDSYTSADEEDMLTDVQRLEDLKEIARILGVEYKR